MVTDQQIEDHASSRKAYVRGCQYFRDGLVRDLHRVDDATLEAKVIGGAKCHIVLRFDKQQKISRSECDCPAYMSWDGACKHIVAALKAVQANWQRYFSEGRELAATPATRKFLEFFRDAAEISSATQPEALVSLLPLYRFTQSLYGTKTNELEFTIGTEKMYVLKNIPQLLETIENGQDLVFGKGFTFRPGQMAFDRTSEKILTMLRQVYAEERQRSSWGWNNHLSSSASLFADGRRFRLTDARLEQFFAAMDGVVFAAAMEGGKTVSVAVSDGRPPLQLAVKAAGGGLSLTPEGDAGGFRALDSACRYLFYQNTIYRVDAAYAAMLQPLLRCFAENRKPEVLIPAPAVSEFVVGVLPSMAKTIPVAVEDAVYSRFHRESLEKRVYLDRFEEGAAARVEFAYGPIIINPDVNAAAIEGIPGGKWLLRLNGEERQVTGLLLEYGFRWEQGSLVQPDETGLYSFLQSGLPALQEIAEVFSTDAFKRLQLKPPGRISAGVSMGDGDLLSFHLEYDLTPDELIELLTAYKLKKRYHRLADGSFVSLDTEDFSAAAELIEELGLSVAEIEEKTAVLPKYRAMYLDSVMRDKTDIAFERSSEFRKLVREIREPQELDFVLPQGIRGRLRDYQKTGFKWMKSLASYGFGGILADDMGLGKTLQVIALLVSEQAKDALPSLVVAPTSLIYNWQEEVDKFAPQLKVCVVSGQQTGRFEQIAELEQADLVVTTYGLLKRDIKLYEEKTFTYCFLDEAQHIKNANTLGAKAVKRIKARSYFALTGTPVENTLAELWSIFDFIMPGYLWDYKTFAGRFENPIVRSADQVAAETLSRHIKPFILRRMKKQVLKELPQKTESKIVAEMTAEQAKVHAACFAQARQELAAVVEAEGFARGRIKILALLTRLRQVCCHPSLFLEGYQGGSGKLELLLELLKDAADGGHRALVFSQFTSMLALIKPELEKIGLSYYYLDGSTGAEERLRMVNSFNKGDRQVFLISLKAGGSGLNLTGADIVIHYDPWWNPAVEDQATDRAYRIGQQNPVQVYKLITRGSIEDKIYTLQQKKKELIDSLIQPGETFLAKMEEAEIKALFEP